MLIMLSGGLASPTEALPTPVAQSEAVDDTTLLGDPIDVESLVDCGGSPCPSNGAGDAPVTMIEISEYGCPHCRDHNMDVVPLIQEEFVDAGDVRLVTHVFGIAPTTIYLSSAALCAKEQGMFSEFHYEVFKDDLALSGADLSDRVREIAERIGLDTDPFMECAEEVRYVDAVQQSTVDAQRAGIMYTPTFVINGLIIEGGQPIEIFRMKIEQALAEES
jgi:protein-disulfide isomerase